MTQLSLLPEPPPRQKPVDPDKRALWSTGLYNLASLLGLPNDKARNLLGRLAAAAKHDNAALTELIARAVELRPDEKVSWLIAGARKIGGRGDDPWRLREWYAAATQAVRDWPIEEYEEIMTVSGLAPSWHGSLAPLEAWIVHGYRPDSIADVIAAAPCSAHDWKPGPVYSLKFWDGIVRRRAARWDTQREEWRVV